MRVVGHFLSRDKKVGYAIRSAMAENLSYTQTS